MLRRWVETWQRAGEELDEIRRGEIQSFNTQRAIRQLFGPQASFQGVPARATSGLAEQQAWFAKMRRTLRPPLCP